MFTFSLRTVVALLIILSAPSAYAQTKVVVVPLGGDEINQCEAITACENGQQTLSCPSGDEQISCAVPKRVFVTSTSHDGDLGGLSGADAICQNLANAQGMNGVFKAWLSATGESPNTRFVQNPAPYVLLNDEIIADNYADLIDGNLDNPIDIDELGRMLFMEEEVYTGTSGNGSGENSPDCFDWSDGSFIFTGGYGLTSSVDSTWTNTQIDALCDEEFRLYCFEQ